MKEILKLWYSAKLKGSLHELIIMLLFVPFIYFFTIYPMLRGEIEAVIVGYSITLLLGVTFCGYLWAGLLDPLFAIVNFKKRFSFLPPMTNEGRIAMQSRVDFALHIAAQNFFLLCAQEKQFVSLLVDKKEAPELLPAEIRATELNIERVRKDLKNFKKQFWQKHAAAKSDLLPAAFEVYPSIHNYETNPPRKTVPKKKKLAPPSSNVARSSIIKWEEV